MTDRIISDRFTAAFNYACDKHQNQTRKGTDIPYISHLMAVSGLVMEHGGNEDEAIAALLHDVVEDQGGAEMLNEIRSKFGNTVAEVVEGCSDSFSDDPEEKLPWKERKQAYINHLATDAFPSTLLVSMADKLHNARAMLTDYSFIGEPFWTRFNATKEEEKWYYHQLLETFRNRAVPLSLYREFERVVKNLTEAIEKGVH